MVSALGTRLAQSMHASQHGECLAVAVPHSVGRATLDKARTLVSGVAEDVNEKELAGQSPHRRALGPRTNEDLLRDIHPNVRAALGMARELRHRIAEMRERADKIVARRPSPSGLVVPEVDAMGRLLDLYLAPGTCARFDNGELAAEIMAAITESAEDARRQHHFAMNSSENLPRPLADIMAEWRAGTESNRQAPIFGKAEE
ncbi:hypothetical protein [Nocardia gipuzkoensis]